MKNNIIPILENNSNLVVSCLNSNLDEQITNFYRDVGKKFKRIGVVTINRSFSALKERLEQNKIDFSNFYFLDCISAMRMQQIKSDQCTYVSSPYSLTELALDLSFLINKFDLIIIDNINGLLLYNSEVLVLRFLNSLMSKIQINKKKAVYWIIPNGKSSIVSDISLFADKVVVVGKF
jgi:hypothetical protein